MSQPVDGYKAPELTDEQKTLAGPAMKAFNDLCLLSGLYKGQPVAFLCRYWKDERNGHCIAPLFIVVTEAMKDDCQDCSGLVPGPFAPEGGKPG